MFLKLQIKPEGRWKHISSLTFPHAYMTNYLENIKETLIKPYKIFCDEDNPNKAYYLNIIKIRNNT